MMIQDILSKEHTIKVGEKIYKLEFDNKAYAKAEQVTGKGLFCLYNEFIIKSNLTYNLNLEILCCALMKHHSEEEIAELKKEFEQKPFLFIQNYNVLFTAFMEPLMPPEIMEQNKKKVQQKKSQLKKASIG
ncbi:MAG: hypothetical protein KHX03_09360 [Clostridium sp.]|nr:hypothetical protein [Clostridium sp.]